MKITLKTDGYNRKRHGKPYTALCDETSRAQTWGDWLGTPGCSVELSFTVPANVSNYHAPK